MQRTAHAQTHLPGHRSSWLQVSTAGLTKAAAAWQAAWWNPGVSLASRLLLLARYVLGAALMYKSAHHLVKTDQAPRQLFLGLIVTVLVFFGAVDIG